MTPSNDERPIKTFTESAGIASRIEPGRCTVVQALLERLGLRSPPDSGQATEALREKEFTRSGTESVAERAVEPDVIAASILLGTAMSASVGLLDRLASEAPVVVIEVPDETWIGPMTAVAVSCFRDPGVRRHFRDDDHLDGEPALTRSDAVVVAAAENRIRSSESADKRVTIAFHEHRPLIGISTATRSRLPEDLLAGCEETVVVGRLDPASIRLLVHSVVGRPPSFDLSAEIADEVSPADLRIAAHKARGADGSIERLRALVDARRQKRLRRSGPRLAELAGYGAAREWGIAAAADLAAYANKQIPWSYCEPGVLLSGAPGTGKTMFASALAAEARVDYVVGSLAQWQSSGEGHLGTTLKAMRQFFEDARRAAPCIALIDEVDSFGDRRRFAQYHRDYGVQIVNGLLECLDGDGGRVGVVLVGTTNNPDRIDPAIMRSGRFDRHIEISLPTINELAAILRHHLDRDLEGVDLMPLARHAVGGTGADCAAWVRRARGRARRAGRNLDADDLASELVAEACRAVGGDEWRTAVHESGHAIVAYALGYSVREVALRRNDGPIGGSILYDSVGPATPEAVRKLLAVVLAGRAAETRLFGEPSAGAASDLDKATTLCVEMHCRWGLGSGLAVYDPGPALSSIRRLVERELRRATKRAAEIVASHQSTLEMLATALLDRRALTGAEVATYLSPGLVNPGILRTPS